jgi:hypothetical protein
LIGFPLARLSITIWPQCQSASEIGPLICNHCPFVFYVSTELVRIANDYLDDGISCIAISNNDVANYPQDGPDKMKSLAAANHYPFPYLYDETQ